MADRDRDRAKAIAAVEAMFERYRLLVAKRPKDHIVILPFPSRLPAFDHFPSIRTPPESPFTLLALRMLTLP
jgi:hypothetical protein